MDLKLLELLARIDGVSNSSEVLPVVEVLRETYGLKTVEYLASGFTQRPYLAVTYSLEWVKHYEAERFLDVDPAIQIGLRRILPIDWEEFDLGKKNVRRLFGEAREFGLGHHGISLPVHGYQGDWALISITSDATSGDWQRLRRHYIRDFQILALHLHQAILRIEGGQRAVATALSQRERECLQWIAEGKTNWECAVILGLSERTVRFYLESARHKLGATNTTHAVTKAAKASLLSELP